ncbi:glycoside-pentoside-hexuronide (GPH):cation symporter [Shewanella inventionis]|uniref:MFS transporter n=1 Tax=Shewanella inventionis TaxID=1738770 RepID=A0ABQ1JAG0_9GAMM|nr:glycoside-pentoside-hexuronide (GPH):cation symporter [Shewanella inventionis]MCL1159162.1 glycoside-pentoside-hexuronide (GPH):cation symporter [Shewanella inventionis]UAL45057.1 glycoside-pentoside-hexuronide (GPH):cation symporter [Shewanella inventionis]GGB61855.1 MFS transporter [Shewanella inventionis]
MISIKEKIAYGLGDTASNIVFQTVMLFLTFFYTDIFGISPAFVGTMFLAVRLIDAVTDPLMGALADRTNTRWGKFRPYLLWFALPFGFISVLAFTTPDLTEDGKMIYAFVTYTALMMVYTAINIPYCALGGVLTADPRERVSVQSYRFVFAMIGGLLVSGLTLPLVEFLGQGDQAKGYQLTITAMSILGVAMFLVCFWGTKERLHPPVDQQSSFKKDFGDMLKNDQWRVLAVAAVCLLSGMVLRTSLAIYYVKYYLNMPDSITLFITLGMVGNIFGCILAEPLAKRICKVKAYIGLQIIAAALCVLSYFVPSEQVVLAFFMFIAWGFTFNMATPLLWAKMADVVDYGQYKNGVRITGMIYSSVIFFIKLGVAIGGAAAGWLLAGYGYQADTAQTAETQQGILLSFTIYPAIGSILVAFVMRWYILDNQQVDRIHLELNREVK